MNIVQESEDLAVWLHDRVDGLAIPDNERSRIVAGCFDTVLEHQQAVTLLIKYKLYGSAFTLARPIYEAYIRGIWLHRCATDQQVQDFLNDKLNRKFDDLISDIEKIEGYSDGVLSRVKNANWNLLCSFTHTGFNQVIRRNTDMYIEPNYSDEDIKQIINFVNSLSLLTGIEIAFLAGDQKLPIESLEKIEKYKKYP